MSSVLNGIDNISTITTTKINSKFLLIKKQLVNWHSQNTYKILLMTYGEYYLISRHIFLYLFRFEVKDTLYNFNYANLLISISVHKLYIISNCAFLILYYNN